jgi:hypothetical protein
VDGAAIDRLPTAYAVALRMRRAGATDDEIATALGLVDAATAAITVALAEAKLAALTCADPPSGSDA